METTATLTATTYASIGRRFVALLIDGLVFGVIYGIIVTPILAAIGLGVASEAQNFEGMTEEEATQAAMGMAGTVMAGIMTMMVAIYILQVIYYTLLESSKLQGSLGKLAMGIKVVDANGERLTIGKAFLRAIGRVISQSIAYIGFIIAAFNEKKQGLHDMIAGTFVVKK